ncbi:hypothetical protein MSAN_02353100 [Mycena sanguinolenta]|uniref:Uncharacterized protein n=1 Tax=Mycena sanguinolenta TaxID=230812 RepID=A0A8H6X6C3_9AGAR|nr:hypothetical protein MSAN_02353100 [Mycena sanguinolenta]
METWVLNQMKSLIGTRAFTTSQSAQAHLILFTRIFEIAHADTGIPCRFRHIHGEGFELWITDSHKGQALGAGKFCQKLCAELGDTYWPMERTRLLRSLTPCDHLSHFLRFCTVHFIRNIDKIRAYITPEVRRAMLSLSSSQVHPDLEGAFRIIENGGRKAKAWLKDKRTGSPFALPALYQPLSCIPLEIWKSGSSTTNGNEQSHRNINRDGVNLTLLGGVMRGMQYDARAIGAIDLYSSQGIYVRDQTATHFRRLQRSHNRHIFVQSRNAAAAREIEKEDSVLPSQTTTVNANKVTSKPARVHNAQPLFSTGPLPPTATHVPPPLSSWLDEYMQVDVPSTQPLRVLPNVTEYSDFSSSSSFYPAHTGANDLDILPEDNLDQYWAMHHVPLYPFDATTVIPYDHTPYLHIPGVYDLPQQSRTLFSDLNS